MVVYDAQTQLYELMENANRQLQMNIGARGSHQNLGESANILEDYADTIPRPQLHYHGCDAQQ